MTLAAIQIVYVLDDERYNMPLTIPADVPMQRVADKVGERVMNDGFVIRAVEITGTIQAPKP